MKKITSFCVDHDHLEKGMYVSREDGDVITYDLRMVKPNQGGYLENAGLHTLEHLFATYVRNTEESDAIVYVGPMGCRTGFYLLTRDTLSRARALALVQETMAFIAPAAGNAATTAIMIWPRPSAMRKHTVRCSESGAQRAWSTHQRERSKCPWVIRKFSEIRGCFF